MLRKRLLLVLASLTMLMLGSALSAVMLMNGMLQDLEHINSIAMAGTTASGRMGTTVAQIETELAELQRSGGNRSAALVNSTDSLTIQIEELHAFYDEELGGDELYKQLSQSLVVLEFSIDEIIGAPIAAVPRRIEIALFAINRVRRDILLHADFALAHMNREQAEVTTQFRMTAIGLAVVFVILINVSVIVLLRTASSILRPVDRLIEASRHLAREDYAYRVDVARSDEFDELARGFNSLAQHLQDNEERKVETLHQVARTLNHELNNAIAIIELQLRIVTKSPDYDSKSGEQLRLIHETLERMKGTVAALTKVRRVVLTEYTKGVKMLDLKLSTQPKAPDASDEKSPNKVRVP